MQNAVEFAYFRAVPGKVVARFGTKEFVGARRVADGWLWSNHIIALPKSHVARYMREYKRAVSEGALVECTKSDWEVEQLALAEEAETRGEL